ncbi:hypothetical protein FACS1894218_2790 [Bacilli bacterium]|nr:hypothetical protein FACS1894218_2790 [Bacilli bacterium]
MNNMFGLKNYQEEQALDYFDYSRAYSYNFNNELVADRNDPNTLPMFIPTIGRIDYPQWVDPPTNPTDFIN